MANYSLEDVEKELLERRAAARSLHEFVKQAWPQVEGNRPFVDGWVIGAICEHLQAVKDGQIERLLINQPPRTMKSLTTSVFFPSWWWIDEPAIQFLYGCHSFDLAMRDALKCRRLIESDWYANRWGSRVRLTDDQSRKERFENIGGGARVCITTGSKGQGENADVQVLDDPNNSNELSDTILNSINDWYSGVFTGRANDRKKERMVVTQQRIHENDVSGYILANYDDSDWVKLILPMEYEPERKIYTIPLPSTNGKPWGDPRTKAGELLWPERVGPKELAKIKKDLQSEFKIAGQLQQRPAPAEGGIFKRAWFKLWPANRPFPPFEYVLQSYDTAFTEKTHNDPTACSVWGIFKEDGRWNALLLDCWEDFLEYPQLRKKVVEEYASMYGDPPRAVDMILIEDKGSGIALRRDLQQAGLPVKAYNPGKADKIQRAHMVTYLVENGLIYLPESDKEERRGKVRTWIEPFLEQLTMFPNAKRDDYCFAAGTKVATLWGDKNIEDIKEGDFVLTPFGFSRVLGTSENLSEVILYKNTLVTKEHPYFTFDKGFIPVDTISRVNKLCEIKLWSLIKIILQKASNTMERSIRLLVKEGTTFPTQVSLQSAKALKGCTWQSGKMQMVYQSPKVLSYTIRTVIHLIMIFPILSWYRAVSISGIILKSCGRMGPNIKKDNSSIWNKYGPRQLRGMVRRRVSNGIASMEKMFLGAFLLRSVCVQNAALSFKQETLEPPIAVNVAGIRRSGGDIWRKEPLKIGLLLKDILGKINQIIPKIALGVRKSSSLKEPPSFAQRSVATKTTTTKLKRLEMVYNLKTANGLYFADGLLVHNCDTFSGALLILKDMRLIAERPDYEEEDEKEPWDSEYAGNPYAQ